MKERFMRIIIVFLAKEEKTMNTDNRTCHSEKGCKEHIKGIRCDVKNCVYHDSETYCTAGQIAVGPSSATTGADTLCATFKERK
jgi:hypothetical protein